MLLKWLEFRSVPGVMAVGKRMIRTMQRTSYAASFRDLEFFEVKRGNYADLIQHQRKWNAGTAPLWRIRVSASGNVIVDSTIQRSIQSLEQSLGIFHFCVHRSY